MYNSPYSPAPAYMAASANNGSDAHNDNSSRARRGTSLVIRNVIVEGRRTSIRLEPEMWRSLQEICKRERCSAHDIATMVAAGRTQGSLTAALRVFVMAYFRAAATEDGHNTAGHGSGRVLEPLYSHIAEREGKTQRPQHQPSNGRF